MELSERMMAERYELGSAQEDAALRIRSGLSVAVLTLALTATAGILLLAMIETLDGWANLIVLGALFATVMGLMIAIAPNRRG
jgi:hypothetical protein